MSLRLAGFAGAFPHSEIYCNVVFKAIPTHSSWKGNGLDSSGDFQTIWLLMLTMLFSCLQSTSSPITTTQYMNNTEDKAEGGEGDKPPLFCSANIDPNSVIALTFERVL